MAPVEAQRPIVLLPVEIVDANKIGIVRRKAQRFAIRVGNIQEKTWGIAPVERNLQRIEVARPRVLVLHDVSIASEGPQKITGKRAVARYRRIGRLGGILVLRQEGRAIGYRIEIDLLDQVTGGRTHISGIEHQRVGQLGLNPEIESVDHRDLG